MPMKDPPHPGDFIKTEIVEALGLNVHVRNRLVGIHAMNSRLDCMR
jgi:plasmid maintenance system antidote protein VapI